MKPITILGIRCELEEDENGFFNVFIADGNEILLPEWIIREVVGRREALEQAEVAIKHRLRGDVLLHHHPEGHIQVLTKEKLDQLKGESQD